MHACMHLPVPFSCSPQLSNKHYVRKGGPALLERVLMRVLRQNGVEPVAMQSYCGEDASAALAQLMEDLEKLS